MKNIHVIPTDKPSRLHLESNGLKLSRLQNTLVAQNIYITSDDEIKDGDWMIRGNEQPTLVTPNFFWDFGVRYYKIILTTDQDLIKDGVQAIDDEFLEWFVANPSCEQVDFWKYMSGEYSTMTKEEPKQELPQFGTKEFNDLATQYFGGKPSTKLHKGEVVDESYPKEFKQETLEEAAVINYKKIV